MSEYKITYLSLGAGIQSTALLIMSNQGHPKVPRADVAIFADTGDEPPWVYENVERLKDWSDIPVEVVTAGCLSDDVIARHDGTKSRFAAIPAFTEGEDGKATILRRQCTREYKIAPIHKKVRKLLGYEPRQRIPAKSALCLLGISAEENARMRPSRDRWIVNSFPLFDARITRDDCYPIIRDAGLPVPGKSSCLYCPFHNNAFWRELKEKHPEQWERSCQLDEAFRDMSQSGVKQPVFLHRSLKPLREAPIGDDYPELFDPFSFRSECMGICGT